jgi:hypothetical protein
MAQEDERDLAKQLGVYADSIAAFAFLQAAAFGYALANTDFHKNVHAWPGWLFSVVLLVSLLVSGFYLLVAVRCHAGQDDLTREFDKGNVPEEPDERSKILLWTSRVRRFRILIILFAAVLSTFALVMTWRTPA